MARGEGKGWAKGRTAANDPRIARNAVRHRGLTYERHLRPEDDRRYAAGGGPRTLPLEWSDDMAYVVGLMATDGCLVSRGRRYLSFDSGDEQLVRTFLACLGRPMFYRALPTATGGVRFKAQFSDVRFYRWLESIGLTPRKSLTLGGIDVPDEHLFPLVRGLFEGDGNIANFTHHPTIATYPDYEYERLWVFFTSASRPHLEWIQGRVRATLGARGTIEAQKIRPPRHAFFRLKYGNGESVPLLKAMYPDETVPMLKRKWAIWAGYARRHGIVMTDAGCAEGGT